MALKSLVEEEIKLYTIVQIDEHLTHISNVIKYSKRRERQKCLVVADVWLDRRLELMAVVDGLEHVDLVGSI